MYFCHPEQREGSFKYKFKSYICKWDKFFEQSPQNDSRHKKFLPFILK